MQEALSRTWDTLNARLRNYRISAIAFLLSLASVPVLALLFRTPWALAGLSLPPVLALAMLWRDLALVHEWEERILQIWRGGGLPLAIFAKTVASLPFPLEASRKAMAAALAAGADDAAPSSAEAARRLFLAATRRALAETRLVRVGYRATAVAAMGATVAAVSFLPMDRLIPGLLLGVAALPASRIHQGWVLRRWIVRIRMNRAEPGEEGFPSGPGEGIGEGQPRWILDRMDALLRKSGAT
jgi:hypothetical protein